MGLDRANQVPESNQHAQETAEKRTQRLPSCEPQDVFQEVTDILRKIKKERDRPLYALISHNIHDEICDEVCGWRSELKVAGKGDKLDVLVHSPGGTLTSCYMVGRLFSRCVDAWEALVPEYAASGATLICLGSSKIVMSEIAQLGPLDPQVISRRREKFFQGERQSPLEAFQAVGYLRKFSLESLDAVMMFLLDQGVAPHLALEAARTFALNLAEPILGKIEPYDLGAFALDSRVAIDYCRRIGDPGNRAKKTQRDVDPRVLVESYATHEFVIDVDEARELGFNATEPTPEIDTLFDELRAHLKGVYRYVGIVS